MYKKAKVLGQVLKISNYVSHGTAHMVCPPCPFDLHCLIKGHECHFPPLILHNTEVFFLAFYFCLVCDLISLVKSISHLICLFQNSSLTSSISIMLNLFSFELAISFISGTKNKSLSTENTFILVFSILFDWWVKQRCVAVWLLVSSIPSPMDLTLKQWAVKTMVVYSNKDIRVFKLLHVIRKSENA